MLVIDGLRKSFYDPGRGPVTAVDRIGLEARPGGVIALAGANGAGKTTLLRLIATLLEADAGRILVDGIDAAADPLAVRRRIGFLSQSTRLYPRLSGREMLGYAAGFFGLHGEALEQAIARISERLELGEFLDQRCARLSTGQAQRINIARTLITDPPLLILDEPTTGLDLAAARQVIDLIHRARSDGRLIILSTHIVTEIEELADRLLIMDHGRLVFDDRPAVLGHGEALARAICSRLRLEGSP